MATADERVVRLEERVKNLELFVIGILKAFQSDGRVDPGWLEEVRGHLDTGKPQSPESAN